MNMKVAVLSLTLTAGSGAWAAEAKGKADGPAALKSGYRSVTIPLESFKIEGIEAGDRVDMLITFDAKMADGKPETVTATILQNVAVLGIAKDRDSVVLALNPNEAQYAVLSLTAARMIWFLKRAPGDDELKPMEMASYRKLFR